MTKPDSRYTPNDSRKPLICPKGYGLCWGCEIHCDQPGAKVKSRDEGSCYDPDEYRDADYYRRFGLL